jgi:hypothetical protein
VHFGLLLVTNALEILGKLKLTGVILYGDR